MKATASSGSESEGTEEREEALKSTRKCWRFEMRMGGVGAKEQVTGQQILVVLGLANTMLSDVWLATVQPRLFFFSSFGHKDPYKIYDWPLFHSSTAAAAIYKEEEGNNASTSSWIDNRCHYNCKLQEISPRTPNVMISHVSKSHSQPLARLTRPAQICISLCPWEHRLTHQLNRGEPLVSSTTAVAPYPIDDATIVLSYLKVAIL